MVSFLYIYVYSLGFLRKEKEIKKLQQTPDKFLRVHVNRVTLVLKPINKTVSLLLKPIAASEKNQEIELNVSTLIFLRNFVSDVF